MLRTALRNVLAHKARLSMTALAVMLGVAFVAGTLVFGDTVTQAFRNASTKNLDGVAVSVQAEYDLPPEDAEEDDADGTSGHPPTSLTPALADHIRGLPDVTAVHPVVIGYATLSAKDGNPYKAQYSWQNLATNYVPSAEANSTSHEGATAQDSRYPLTAGRGPVAEHEIALDTRTAKEAGYEIGDTVRLATDGPALTKTLVGTVDTDDPRVTAGGTLTLFDTATAQRLFLNEGQFHEFTVSAAPGADSEALTAEVDALLPAGRASALSGTQLAHEQAEQITESSKALTQMLLVFAGIALFVGVFLIANTFSMLIAQRTREIALLRAVGASSRQVVRSVLIEAALLGLVASMLGFGIGLGIAVALRPLLNAGGAGLPEGPLVVSTGAVLWSLAVGVLVTVLAAWLPSERASRIAPIEALSTVDQAPPVRDARLRNILGSLTAASGVLIMLLLATVDVASGVDFLLAMFGSAATVTGVIMMAPLLSRPLIVLMDRLTTRVFGVSGNLARENALRNPRRTAATASALMIGLTLITTLSVAGHSTEAALEEQAVRGLTADYKVSVDNGLDLDLGAKVAEVDGVADTAALSSANMDVNGRFASISGADPEKLANVTDLHFRSGALTDLGPGRIAVSTYLAKEAGVGKGDTMSAVIGLEGDHVKFTVVGVYEENRVVDDALGTADDILPHAYMGKLDSVLVKARSAGGDLDESIREALGNSPLLKVQTREELTREEAATIDTMLQMTYGLLAMSLIIAVLGVINTLAMSVLERTREIGLLRAIGFDRRGIRQMVRLESVAISLFGAVLGISLGIFLAWANGNLFQSSLTTYETLLPWAQLALFFLLALVTGILAALWPAHHASRLPTLRALAAH